MKNWFSIVQRVAQHRSFSHLIDEHTTLNDPQTKRLWFSIWASDIADASIKFEKAATNEERSCEAGDILLGISACAMLVGLTEDDRKTTSKYYTFQSLSYHAITFRDYAKKFYRGDSDFDLVLFKWLLGNVAARLSEDMGLNEALKAVDQKLKKRFD